MSAQSLLCTNTEFDPIIILIVLISGFDITLFNKEEYAIQLNEK